MYSIPCSYQLNKNDEFMLLINTEYKVFCSECYNNLYTLMKKHKFLMLPYSCFQFLDLKITFYLIKFCTMSLIFEKRVLPFFCLESLYIKWKRHAICFIVSILMSHNCVTDSLASKVQHLNHFPTI